MRSPAHQRRAIIDYFLTQSAEGAVVHHAEKVASERIYGFKHDVWDVDASDGRWWVITNPTNLYPQEMAPTPSMDHALALHIGVTARVLARQHLQAPVDGPPREFVSRTWRKFEQAAEALDQADEPEDFQAVGLRLRECLISFVQETAAAVALPESSAPPQQGNFKGWAELLVEVAAPSSHGKEMRSYLRVMSRETWDLVAWLTHTTNAKRSDADTAVDATSHLLQAFSLALIRETQGEPDRCPGCGSYQVTTTYYRDEDETFLLCEVCGWDSDEPTLEEIEGGE